MSDNSNTQPLLDFADPNLLDISPTDQAEVITSNCIVRYRGWDGRYFTHQEVSCVSLASSCMYEMLFDNSHVRFYRRKKVA